MIKINWSKWFTLVELLVVMTIIWILSTIWIMAFTKYIEWSRDTKRVADITEIETAVITFNTKWYKPIRLGLLADDFKEYPVDPDNWLGYQYNVNTKWSTPKLKKASWKWYVICTNRPLEWYSDTNGDVEEDYLNELEVGDYNKFIGWKLRNKISWKPTQIEINRTIGYYCLWQTDDFDSLVWWWGSNSLWKTSCDQSILDPDVDLDQLWNPCKIIFNADSSSQAVWESPTPGTPMTLSE